MRLEDGWEREEGSSAFLRLVLQLDLDVDEVCSVLVFPAADWRYDKVTGDAA